MMADPLKLDLKTLQGLLKRYSPSGSEQEAAKWLASRMRELGYLFVEVDQVGNTIGVMGDGERQVILLGHIDTVPGEIPLRLEDGRLYGRGAVDAKGPLAAFVDAVSIIGAKSDWQFVVVAAVDEEKESKGARHIINRFRPAYVVVGEPSGWQRCTLGYKGSANAEIRLRRSQMHSAAQQISACDAAFDIWWAVRDWAASFNDERTRMFDQLQLRLDGFSSGMNDIEDWACLQVAARLPEDLTPQSWYSRLLNLCAPETVKPVGYAIPAYRADKNSLLVRAILAGIRSQGGQPGFLVKSGTADMNIVAPIWSCPIIAYGPGDSDLDHTPNEYIHVAEYYRAVAVLINTLSQLVSYDQGKS